MYTKGSIQHTASTVLDIALLPEIQAKSTPQFADCRNNQFKKAVIECKISNSTENYTVAWNTDLSFTEIGPGKHLITTFALSVNSQCKQCD